MNIKKTSSFMVGSGFTYLAAALVIFNEYKKNI
jgi:hypothetical protein